MGAQHGSLPREKRYLPCGFGKSSLKSTLCTIGGIAILMLLVWSNNQQPASRASPFPGPVGNEADNRRLRIIVPADEPGANLCKTLLSAAANGYPAPLIVNWGRDFGKTASSFGGFGGSHIGKIDGVLNALEALASRDAPAGEGMRPDDLVLVVDAYDVWFQLPPRILIERYLAQNAAADARLRDGWSAAAPGAAPPPVQQIIISTQKKCWPRAEDGHETHCDILPESTARTDLYGPTTDQGDPLKRLHQHRPRYINSGAMIGRGEDMLRMFRRGFEKMQAGQKAGKSLFSDQGILGEILGQQEMWRKQEREKNLAVLAGDTWNATDEVEGGAAEWEYGIGLDYVQNLFVPTVFEEDDGEYMILGDSSAVHASSKTHSVWPPRIEGVPSDMADLDSPLRYAGIEGDATWADIPLYADFWSGNVPVGVHHNAHRGGMKAQRLNTWWSKTWFYPFPRDIVAAHSARPRMLRPLAVVRAHSTLERDVVYWPHVMDAFKPLPRIFDQDTFHLGLEEARWHTLCEEGGGRPWWDTIFNDGRGPVGEVEETQY